MNASRYWVALLFLLAILISATYLTISLTTAEGRAVAPLDDAYITFQYARQIARGHPYRYNVGDRPTAGMTSPLFGFLLAVAYLAGVTGEGLVACALALGMVWLGLIAALSYGLFSRVAVGTEIDKAWGLVAAVLVLLTGPVSWACFNGMETGVFTALTLAALYAFLRERMGLAAVFVALAGLTRTEGLILSGLLWSAILFRGFLSDTDRPGRDMALSSAAVLVGLTPYLINWLLTGTPSSAGIRAKSWLLNVPFYPKDIARSILLSFRRIILGRFLAGDAWFVPPGTLVFSILGWTILARRRHWAQLWTTVSWFLVGTLSTATLITATWHMGRYQAPLTPVAIVVATYGLAFLWHTGSRAWQHVAIGALVLYMAIASCYSSFYHAKRYRLSVRTMTQQQLTIADWIRDSLPTNACVGVHDTGSLRYVGQRPTYDVIGLTTPDAAMAWRHGAGSVFEKMEHAAMRPDYFAIYPDVFSIPYLATTDLFAEELFRVEVPNYGVASAGPVQGIWRADWHLAGSGDERYQSDILRHTRGLAVVDTLDLADLEAEAAHNVRWWQEAKRPGFPTELWQLTYQVPPQREVLDGGRLLTGGLAFDTHTEPGKDLWIVARMHAQQAGGVHVEIDGQEVGYWAYPPVPGHWLETAFQVRGDRINHSQTGVTLRVDTDNPVFRHYTPYYFWLLQGDATETTWAIDHRPDVTFGENISLAGFDLPEGPWQSGDRLQVALYWQTVAPTQSEAKVFLHLYDAAGNLVAQSDGWPFHGTRPPYTWDAEKIVKDPRNLLLPGDLPSGDYALEVGLYSPHGSGRLPAYRDDIRQSEDRATLTTIRVVQ